MKWIICMAIAAAAAGFVNAQEAGEKAPEPALERLLQAPESAEVSWEKLRGKAVVLEFWATWCGPCILAIPHLNELAEKFEGKPVQFIAVTNENAGTVERFVKRRSIRAWIGLDKDGSTNRAYGVKAIPRTFLIDAHGTIRAAMHPMALNEDVLNELIAGKEISNASQRPSQEEEPAPRATPLYELAIRPAAKAGPGRLSVGPAELRAASCTLKQLVCEAYQEQPWRVVMEPDPEQLYDVDILLPSRRRQEPKKHLQQILETVFDLQTSRDSAEVDVYLLTRLGDEPPRLSQASDEQAISGTMSGATSLNMTNQNVPQFARQLGRLLRRDVVDETGLEGKFDIEVMWDEYSPEAVIAAVREQLRLELKPARRAVELLHVCVGHMPGKD